MIHSSWKLILISYLMLVIYWIDVDLVSPALPALSSHFGMDSNFANNVMSIDLFVRCACLFVIGPISDRFGRRPFVLLGCAMMLIGSIMCIYSSSRYDVYIGKVVQGSGCSMGMLMYGIITDKFSNKDSASIIAFLQCLLISSIVVAPIMGSHLTYYFGWRYVFLLITLVALIAILSGSLVPETVKREEAAKINVIDTLKEYKEIMLTYGSIKYILIYSISIGGYVCWTVTGPFILGQTLHLGLKEIGMFQTVITLSSAVASLLISIAIPKFGIGKVFKCGVKTMYTSSFVLAVLILMFHTTNKYVILTVLTTFSVSVDMIICSSLTLFYKSFKAKKGMAAAINTIADNTVSAIILVLFETFGEYTMSHYSLMLIGVSVSSFLVLNFGKIRKKMLYTTAE